MSIVFFDIEEWEAERLPKTIAGQAVQFEAEHITVETARRAEAASILSVFSSSQVSGPVLEQLRDLKHIATRSTGFDHIDLATCAKRGITVSNVPTYGDRTVAEHTFALMLALSRKILQTYDRTRHGNFSREGLRGFDLQGKTLGLIGCGKIGSRVAAIAATFAMKIVVYDKVPNEALAHKLGFVYVDSIEELLKQADVISLHVPLTAETKHLINLKSIGWLKPGALLINTARGDLIQTSALLKALDTGRLSGVGLDVLENERMIHEEAEVLSSSTPSNAELATLLNNHILLNHPNVLITPHNAFNSEEAVQKILRTTVSNIEGFLAGQARNLVLSKDSKSSKDSKVS